MKKSSVNVIFDITMDTGWNARRIGNKKEMRMICRFQADLQSLYI